MTLLSPASHLCQQCATNHPATDPHNAQGLFYQTKFGMENDGKQATWLDAMNHCSEEMKKIWTEELEKKDVDVKGGQILPREHNKN